MKTKKKFLTVIGLAAISAVSVFAAGCSGTSWIDQIFCDHETTEIVEMVEPTCTEAGYTEYERCVDCGKEVTEGKEIAAEGHTLKTIAGYDATCTKMGLSDGKECTVCGETVEAQKNIPAKGHTVETVKGKAATCTETGLTDGQACKDCGKVYVAQMDIPAKGHTEDEDGNCTVCGDRTLIRGSELKVGDDLTGFKIRLVDGFEEKIAALGETTGSLVFELGNVPASPDGETQSTYTLDYAFNTSITDDMMLLFVSFGDYPLLNGAVEVKLYKDGALVEDFVFDYGYTWKVAENQTVDTAFWSLFEFYKA
ncbi:MAG: hypothetical protein IJA89_08475 [Clostridia bacterium]|nr:hypothetical protein [Clostridia bacterium]